MITYKDKVSKFGHILHTQENDMLFVSPEVTQEYKTRWGRKINALSHKQICQPQISGTYQNEPKRFMQGMLPSVRTPGTTQFDVGVWQISSSASAFPHCSHKNWPWESTYLMKKSFIIMILNHVTFYFRSSKPLTLTLTLIK